jgi:prevent-host-death family protein
MARPWQVPESGSELSEVVAEALRDGPQVITQHGTATAVVISYDEYRRLLLERQSLSAFFRQSPLVGVELDLARDGGRARDIAL